MMDTRLLRMLTRGQIGYKGRRSSHVISDLGQLQPVTFSHQSIGITFRCEDAINVNGEMTACIRICVLPQDKPMARRLIAQLEMCKATATETPAARAWREYRAKHPLQGFQPISSSAKSTPAKAAPATPMQLDMFGCANDHA